MWTHSPVALTAILCHIFPVRCSPGENDPSFYEERQTDFFQCDRECRWKYGFFRRNITGRRFSTWWNTLGRGNECKCFDLSSDSPTTQMAGSAVIPAYSKKDFDTNTTWSGDFNSKYVCIETFDGQLRTMLRDDALREGAEVIHCGQCAVCSRKTDVIVLSLTRKWITHVMTAASSMFAKPAIMGGHGNLSRLQSNLRELAMNFSQTPQSEFGGTSCMQCWTDNIMNDANNCKKWCWIKFFSPSNPRTDITKCQPWDMNCQCLKCDEEYSGAQFIKCAGANRRSTAIVSDIERPDDQVCKVGMYHGVADEDLPTAPQPSDDEVKRVLAGKWEMW
eukprot:TRINITY_DN22692_c0_g1_i1.p1 TRINITY_DN22692_c0_g1~~TRINITY_DN22692_c0_g1_i1.p1  ORF type:complete len:334 (-),score=40.60 TRINITY_DN22692_c0_g1_i1:240-1241(-)